jgi:hypothetical protein
VLCCANIHGPELVGGEVALGLLAALAGPAGAPLRARAEVWVAPCLNPDGYARTWATGGAASLRQLRPNARGVDLNRNFPLPAGARHSRLPFAGSPRAGSATYRGPGPLSEPESAALAGLLQEGDFHAGANLHSFMGALIPARVTDRSCYETYRRLCARFAAAQPARRYRRLASRTLDVFTGEQEDYQHHGCGTWAVCVEVFPVLDSLRQGAFSGTFWRFNPKDPGPWVENDVPGLLAYFEAALELARPASRGERDP